MVAAKVSFNSALLTASTSRASSWAINRSNCPVSIAFLSENVGRCHVGRRNLSKAPKCGIIFLQI
jgi:hypothetical protein